MITTPETFPRRILLAVTGLSPQVVTETLYGLTRIQRAAFIPTEVHLLTTAEGAHRARLALLSERPGWFHHLRRDYRLPEMRFGEDTIHVIKDSSGAPLGDIRAGDDNERAADLITEAVRELTLDADCAVHASIAGGRKTTGFYLGAALSFFGRPQDRLSHVLVAEPFESSWEFFYPTPYEHIINTRDNKLANCAQAVVTLADIPFVRLRDELPARFTSGRASFSEIVAAANRALQAPSLVLDARSCTVTADDLPIALGTTEFAMLHWLAERASSDEPHVDWSSSDCAEEFLRSAGRVMSRLGSEYERCEKAVRSSLRHEHSRDLLGEYFEPLKSRINKAFVEVLGKSAARRYTIERIGRKGRSRYFVPLSAEHIELRGARRAT
jgi:CRISPR-associated protein (TIGR02584 family)